MVNFRKKTNRHTKTDIWYMVAILGGMHIHIPRMLLAYLAEESPNKPRITTYGGHFVTLIAYQLGVDCSGLANIGMREFGVNDFIKSNVLRRHPRTGRVIKYFFDSEEDNDDEDDDEEAEGDEEEEEEGDIARHEFHFGGSSHGSNVPHDYADLVSRMGQLEVRFEEERKYRHDRDLRVDREQREFQLQLIDRLDNLQWGVD